MPFVQRNSEGRIVALYEKATESATEHLSFNDDEVMRFLGAEASTDEAKRLLSESDADISRILEDLVNLLVDRNIIMFTDLPAAAQKKLLARKSLRKNVVQNEFRLIDDDTIL